MKYNRFGYFNAILLIDACKSIMLSGRKVILYKGYTYYNKRGSYNKYCSKRNTVGVFCQAKLRLEKSGEILYAETDHNHPPPKIVVDADGTYVRLRI